MRDLKCTNFTHRHMLTHRQRLTRSLSMKYGYKLDPRRATRRPRGKERLEWADDGGIVSFAALF